LLFQIAQSLIALEQTLIFGAQEHFNQMSDSELTKSHFERLGS